MKEREGGSEVGRRKRRRENKEDNFLHGYKHPPSSYSMNPHPPGRGEREGGREE